VCGGRENAAELVDECRRNVFIGIEKQDPRMLERDIPQRPVYAFSGTGRSM